MLNIQKCFKCIRKAMLKKILLIKNSLKKYFFHCKAVGTQGRLPDQKPYNTMSNTTGRSGIVRNYEARSNNFSLLGANDCMAQSR